MNKQQNNEFILECALIIVIMGLTALMNLMVGFRLVVLNLYFLPVLLGAFFLGRYRAGVLALLSVVLVTIVAAQDLSQLAALNSPLISALALTIWAGVLGLSTILASTLSDERHTQLRELHEAYFGVIEVLSKYLHRAQPGFKDRPIRIADLSQRIGLQLKMHARDLDDVRVACLLQEMDHIEITARVVRKAIGNFDASGPKPLECTFHASDLVQSLGSVMSGALPLLSRVDEVPVPRQASQSLSAGTNLVLGAQIIRIAQIFDRIVFRQDAVQQTDPLIALQELRSGFHGLHSTEVILALEHVVTQKLNCSSIGRMRTDTAMQPLFPTSNES